MGAPVLIQKYSYADYLLWPEGERWEIIDGVAYSMSPAPSPRHQRVVVNFITRIDSYLAGKSCKLYPAPFDVRLAETKQANDDKTDTVVQPDIVVVCDRDKIDKKGCKGAPDLIIEILSPSSVVMDMKIKLALYEKAGVREYWIVDPLNNIVQVYKLQPDGVYGKPEIYTPQDTAKVGIFDDLEIKLEEVFAE